MFYIKSKHSSLILWQLFLVMLVSVCVLSCRKIVDSKPVAATILETQVFTDNESAIAAVTGIYVSMSSNTGTFSGRNSISVLAGLSSDEFTPASNVSHTTTNIGYYQNTLSATTSPIVGSETWNPLYNLIFRCNSAIANLNASSGEALTPAVRQQLLGEVKFARALFYSYLIEMYGDVPLVVSTDPFVNIQLGRSPSGEVKNFIINELKEAKQLLSSAYLNAQLTSNTNERVRPTRWAATALLARVYLYNRQYGLAEAEATELINQTNLYDTVPLNSVFLKNSKEAIWQLQPTTSNFNTNDAQFFVITNTGPAANRPLHLSSYQLTAFETGDKRAMPGNWINTITVSGTTYYFPFKYKLFASDPNIIPSTGTQNMQEYHMVLRLGEQYLIRAEARAQQNNIPGSRADLLVIRRRAGLADASLTANDQTSLLNALLHERRVELFSEYGHRWFDMKRTGKIDEVMSTITPIKSQGLVMWEPFRQLFPIPQADIDIAPNLTQNPGY